MKRYAIMVRDNYPGAPLTELCQVDTNPEAVKKAAKDKINGVTVAGRYITAPKYCQVEIVELVE